MAKFSIRELLEAGFHFGHQTKRWNPKMGRYIHSVRNGVHIIDLHKSVYLLRDAYRLVRNTIENNGKVLFVGTKRQVVDLIADEAKRCNQPYINHRWLGGTLTNWQTIQRSIRRLKDLERMTGDGSHEALTKKEIQKLDRVREKMARALDGIKDMNGLPDLMVVVDTKKEHIAVREARKLNIPIVALVDTNCDPDPITHVVPGNDDAIRSLGLFLRKMADAVLDGSVKEMKESGDGHPAPTDDDPFAEEMVQVSSEG
ncbi:30S ribosomal protein S2 [Magnetococcales bacterium HHB-1]